MSAYINSQRRPAFSTARRCFRLEACRNAALYDALRLEGDVIILTLPEEEINIDNVGFARGLAVSAVSMELVLNSPRSIFLSSLPDFAVMWIESFSDVPLVAHVTKGTRGHEVEQRVAPNFHVAHCTCFATTHTCAPRHFRVFVPTGRNGKDSKTLDKVVARRNAFDCRS